MVSYSAHDGSDTIAAYWPLFERYARPFVGVKGAEFDDLVQESAIAAWIALEHGFRPSKMVCVRACMRWVRSLNTGGWRLGMEG